MLFEIQILPVFFSVFTFSVHGIERRGFSADHFVAHELACSFGVLAVFYFFAVLAISCRLVKPAPPFPIYANIDFAIGHDGLAFTRLAMSKHRR